jgi:GNAT superfamily N-acetyltransferase
MLPPEYLDRVLADPAGSRACVETCRIVGLASLLAGPGGVADLGVVVEDEWQGRRVGTRLVASLVTGARDRGVSVVTATVLASHARLARALRRVPGTFTITSYGHAGGESPVA